MPDNHPLGFASVIVRAEAVLSSEVAGETVLMSVENGEYYAMDAVASRIWRIIETPHPVAAVCDELLGRFDADREQLERDTLAFFNHLLAKRLIKVAG